MGLILPQMVEVDVSTNGVKYYENLGYKIPKIYDKRHNRYSTPRGTKIKVNVLDLKKNSNIIVDIVCDICGERESITYIEYNRQKEYIEKYGYDFLCLDCKFDIMPTAKINVGSFRDNKDKIKAFLVRKLKSFIEENGYPKNKKKDFKPENKMPTLRMYNDYLGGDLVDWIEMCGYRLSDDEKYEIRHRGVDSNYTKEYCIEKILEMSQKLNRPLKYSDFRNPNKNTIGITPIRKYWGSLNKMKEDLGLEIIQESMINKSLSKEQFDVMVSDIVDYLKNQNRKQITTREINENKNWQRYLSLDRICRKYYNISFSDYIKIFNISLCSQGNGMVYDFEDGEKTTSQYEYLFSKYLRDKGYIYNEDYFRDVKYKSFINGYSGNMNCDYVIKTKDGNIYIEIAGIIADYKSWYYSNKPITYSKSKERYRLKLAQKESMLSDNNIKYYILFPCDLTNHNFDRILNESSLELKKEIEKIVINNIDWKKVRDIEELDYSKDIIRNTRAKKTA